MMQLFIGIILGATGTVIAEIITVYNLIVRGGK